MSQAVGIISIGEMGLGVGKLLLAHGYRVLTFAEDRSEDTRARARAAGIELLPSVAELVRQSYCLLSIVPPRDALATAQRVGEATPSEKGAREAPLYFLDLNAVSPGLAVRVDALFHDNPNVVLIDGGIIGGAPYLKTVDGEQVWNRPALIVSGPVRLPSQPLADVLNLDHLDGLPIGAATGLKMCFASTTKGFIALAIQSYVTADALGVLPQLRRYIQTYNPRAAAAADAGLVSMPPKAYRWVHEMLEIGTTMEENGGFERGLFDGVSEVYRAVADDTELGKEKPDRRVRGTTVEDAVGLIRQGLAEKKLKTE